MAAINPDPHRPEYRFLPNRCVTATFDLGLDAANAVEELRQQDFAESDIRLYTGEEGLVKLDINAEDESLPTKLMQSLTKALADDGGYLERAAGKLKQGGTLVSVSIKEEDEADYTRAVERAATALKSAGGEAVQHWGDWTTEQF
jgi:hypothetical protein